jgi:hypothetical protein
MEYIQKNRGQYTDLLQRLTDFDEWRQGCDAWQKNDADDDVVTVRTRHAVRTCLT